MEVKHVDTESRAAIFPQAREVSGIPLHTPIQLSMKNNFTKQTAHNLRFKD